MVHHCSILSSATRLEAMAIGLEVIATPCVSPVFSLHVLPRWAV